MTASATIFVSSSGTSSFVPVIAEMKNPRDYKKALFTCMAILNSTYLAFSLVVYRWCGQWVANPSLGVCDAHYHLSEISLEELTADFPKECRPGREEGGLWCRSDRSSSQRLLVSTRKLKLHALPRKQLRKSQTGGIQVLVRSHPPEQQTSSSQYGDSLGHMDVSFPETRN